MNDPDPLQIALSAKHHLPAGHAEECRELVKQIALQRPRRHITIADHERWRKTGEPPHKDDNDIEELIQEIRAAQPQERKRK
jgi:hypothetical protein